MMKLAISVLTFLFVACGMLALAAEIGDTRSGYAVGVYTARQPQEAVIRKTCAAGAALVAHVERQLEQEPDAVHLAQDLVAYGLPWLDLCASTPIDPLVVVQPDRAAAAIRALRVDLDRWR